MGKIYGGKCAVANQFTGDQCLSPIAACDTNQGIAGLGGECRPVWWSWLIIGLVALFIIGGFLCCCICCCCSAILDCLCCCCRGVLARYLGVLSRYPGYLLDLEVSLNLVC